MPDIKPSISSTGFTQALSYAANSVCIVATDGPGGRAGLTVSSVCSVCAEPPVMLVCVNSENEFCPAVTTNGVFSVNLLTTKQVDLAMIFSGQSGDPEQDRFEAGDWGRLTTTAPKLHGALVTLDCALSHAWPQGTHMVYTGRVVDIDSIDESPLVYCRREFAASSPMQ